MKHYSFHIKREIGRLQSEGILPGENLIEFYKDNKGLVTRKATPYERQLLALNARRTSAQAQGLGFGYATQFGFGLGSFSTPAQNRAAYGPGARRRQMFAEEQNLRDISNQFPRHILGGLIGPIEDKS